MKNQKLERNVSFDNIVEILRHDILNGIYKPGQQLKQNGIASLLGVSQGPVREALIQLGSEGIVENIPFRGMFVRRLNKKDVEEIYQLRYALEALALKLALHELKNDHHIDKLKQYLELNDKAESEGDYQTAVEMDLGFHHYIVKLSGNSRLIDIWDSLLAQAQYVLRQLYETSKSTNEAVFAKNHIVILNAVHDASYPELCTILDEHMKIASRRLSKMIVENNTELP